MNKKKLVMSIIIIAVIILCMLIIFLTLVNNKDESLDTDKDSFGLMTEENYYVEKGIEEPAKLAKLAVEEYLLNKPNETPIERSNRLEAYFVEDSPAYNSAETKAESSAQVTSITSCEEQEGGYWCLFVMVKLKNNNQPAVTRTYWITVQEFENGLFKALDLGVWK